MLARKALAGTAGAPKEYVEDVFSTYLYTGTGASQTITNNIDLSTKGGLVWTKNRDTYSYGHELFDTVRGAGYRLASNSTAAEGYSLNYLSSFNSNGFTIGSGANANVNGVTNVSWTFRKAKKFFDVVTYTGNGTAGRTVSHNLGSVPGCIIIKDTTNAGTAWAVYHRSVGNTKYLWLHSTDAEGTSSGYWNNTTPTSTEFTVGTNSNVNGNGYTYVAYLFAHDAGGFGDAGSDSIIKCGSFTKDGSGNADVTLDWEPQWILTKTTNGSSSVGDNWLLADTMRGAAETGNTEYLYANTSGAANPGGAGGAWFTPTATGFKIRGLSGSSNHIYIAIRRGPMKTPTSGTSVFSPQTYTETITNPTTLTTGWPTDLHMISRRTGTTTFYVADRLRGSVASDENFLQTPSTAAETDYSNTPPLFTSNTGIVITSLFNNSSGQTDISYQFRRAPGFFDVVCYTGTGSATTVTHNLGVVPELMIVKKRSAAESWVVYTTTLGNTGVLFLNSNGTNSGPDTQWNSTTPTSSVFSLGSNSEVNGSGSTFVAYLFASLTGISKIGSYTGNGSNQTINCGFSAGARFVLIKSQSGATGDWVVFDSARGIVSGDDPYLLLNSTAAEVTNKDAVDTDNTGFVVNETTGPNINTSGTTYLYLAIA
jgi:hypothetical protein